jgi:hypothetical protein
VEDGDKKPAAKTPKRRNTQKSFLKTPKRTRAMNQKVNAMKSVLAEMMPNKKTLSRRLMKQKSLV